VASSLTLLCGNQVGNAGIAISDGLSPFWRNFRVSGQLQLALQSGPMAARSLALWPSASTVLFFALAGSVLRHRRAVRLARGARKQAD